MNGKKDILGMYRKSKVLAIHYKQFKDLGSGGHPDRLCGRALRFFLSHRGDLSANRGSIIQQVRNSPNLCPIRTSKSKVCICCSDRGNRLG